MVRTAPNPRRTDASLSLAQSFITTDFSSDLFGEASALSLEDPQMLTGGPRLTKREKDIMSLPWTNAYAAAAKTGTLSNANLPNPAPPLDLAAALGLSPMPAVKAKPPPPIIIPRVHDATQLISADPTFAEHTAAAEAVEVALEEERQRGDAENEEADDAMVLPTAHEVASSVVSTLGDRFDRYRQALLTNQVGKARLRHVDSNSLLGANVHDFDDLRALSAHLRGLVGEAERRHAASEALRWRLELSEELGEEAWRQAEEAALDHAEQSALHAAAPHGAAHSPPSPTTRAARGSRPHSAQRPRLAATPPALLPLELGEAGPPTAPAGRSVGRSVRAQRTSTFGAESAFGRRLNYSPPPMVGARVSMATSETPPQAPFLYPKLQPRPPRFGEMALQQLPTRLSGHNLWDGCYRPADPPLPPLPQGALSPPGSPIETPPAPALLTREPSPDSSLRRSVSAATLLFSREAMPESPSPHAPLPPKRGLGPARSVVDPRFALKQASSAASLHVHMTRRASEASAAASEAAAARKAAEAIGISKAMGAGAAADAAAAAAAVLAAESERLRQLAAAAAAAAAAAELEATEKQRAAERASAERKGRTAPEVMAADRAARVAGVAVVGLQRSGTMRKLSVGSLEGGQKSGERWGSAGKGAGRAAAEKQREQQRAALKRGKGMVGALPAQQELWWEGVVEPELLDSAAIKLQALTRGRAALRQLDDVRALAALRQHLPRLKTAPGPDATLVQRMLAKRKVAAELDAWAEVLRSGTADAPPVTTTQAIGHPHKPSAMGGSSQGLATAVPAEGAAEPASLSERTVPPRPPLGPWAPSRSATTEGAQADGWQRLYLELYRGALRLAARPNVGYRGGEDRSRGVLPLFGQVVTLAPPKGGPKGGSNRPFQLQLCNVDARDAMGEPLAEPEVHTLAFDAHDTAVHWRALLTARVEEMEREILHEMRVAAAWCMDVYEPRKLWLPSRREEHAAEVASSEAPLPLKVMIAVAKPGIPVAGPQQVEARLSSPGEGGSARGSTRAAGRGARGRVNIVPQAGPATRARQEFERAALLNPRLSKVRPLLAAFFGIKGGVLWKLTKGGAGEGHPRYFRLLPSDSMLQWDSAEPLVLLGARPGFSVTARQHVRPSPALAERAFRFIFAGAEVDVVARSVAERSLWLLAVQSLPIGAAYLGKVEIVSKFDVYADTGCEGTAISRRRAKG